MRSKRRASAPNNKNKRKKSHLERGAIFIFCLWLSRWNSCRSSLNVDNGRALVAAAARQVAERADQVGQAAGRRALGHHVADQALAGLLADALFDGFLQRLALEITEVIVGEVLELQLVRRADKALGVAGGDDGVSELPDLADGVFERTVAVDHGLDVLAAGLAESLAQLLSNGHAVAREELNGLLGRLVGAEQSVFGVVAAAVDASVEQIVEAEHHAGAAP